MSPPGPASDVDAARAAASRLSAEVAGGLSAKVYSKDDRRCPFFKEFSEREESEVDSVCDIRVQEFSDLPPFGPKDLEVCRLCISAKDIELKDAQFEEQKDLAEQALGGQGGEGEEGEGGG